MNVSTAKENVTLSEVMGLFITLEMLRFAQHDKIEFFQRRNEGLLTDPLKNTSGW